MGKTRISSFELGSTLERGIETPDLHAECSNRDDVDSY